jgi:hypothetical protein
MLTRGKAGRPRRDVSSVQVTRLAELGCTVEEIAYVVGCHRDTLYARPDLRQAITKGSAVGKVSLRRLQWKAARKGSAAMLIWLGKQLLGQSDKVDVKDATPAERHAEAIRRNRERRLADAPSKLRGEKKDVAN